MSDGGLTTTYVYDGGHSDQSRSRGQLTGVSYGDGSYARSLGYNAKGQLVTETVALAGAPQVYTATYLYDGYDRLNATVYPDGEVVAAQGFDSRGLVTGLLSSGLVTPPVQAAVLVDNLRYDAAGRLARLRYATVNSSNGITLTHYYYNWTGNDGNANGRYWGMNVSTVAESADVMAARYAYDTYANVTYQAFTWQNRYSDANTIFAYDDQNRVTVAYGQGFGWQPWGSLGSVGGDTYGYAAGHPHAVDLVNGADRYDYDANGNMVVRSKGVSGQEQALQWDADNRLAQVVSSSGVTETYRYDEHGQRIRRQAAYSSSVGDTVTYVPFVFYEQAVSAGGSVVTKHYSVNGERVAVRVGGALSYLYHDQVGSTILATDASSNVVSSRGYYAFGATRRSSGVTPTDRRFTGQVEDGTGLYYYNSRYYDPQLGQFISPDTIVPEPTNLLSYNRYLYAKGNPLKHSDPTGHCAVAAVAGPAGLAIDVPCWVSGAGEAIAIATASAVSAASLLKFALDDPLPDYAAPTTTGDVHVAGASFPLPGSTTIPINEGIPLVQPLDTIVPGEQSYDPSKISVLADPLPTTGTLPLVFANNNQGWSLGDPITNLTSKGNLPSWSTVRARFWKNEAQSYPDRYDASNTSRMQRGLAPQRLNPTTGKIESMDLHHEIPQREGGLFEVVPLWPSDHARIDPYRHP